MMFSFATPSGEMRIDVSNFFIVYFNQNKQIVFCQYSFDLILRKS